MSECMHIFRIMAPGAREYRPREVAVSRPQMSVPPGLVEQHRPRHLGGSTERLQASHPNKIELAFLGPCTSHAQSHAYHGLCTMPCTNFIPIGCVLERLVHITFRPFTLILLKIYYSVCKLIFHLAKLFTYCTCLWCKYYVCK